MQVTAYLNFKGDCEDALKFYERVLGGEIDCLMRYEGTPAEQHASLEDRNKVLHGRLNVDGQIIMASDCPPDRYQKPQGFMITLGIKAPAEAERVFRALAENGTVSMPIQETFWPLRYGTVTDRFGTPWMINCEKPAEIFNQSTEPAYASSR